MGFFWIFLDFFGTGELRSLSPKKGGNLYFFKRTIYNFSAAGDHFLRGLKVIKLTFPAPGPRILGFLGFLELGSWVFPGFLGFRSSWDRGGSQFGKISGFRDLGSGVRDPGSWVFGGGTPDLGGDPGKVTFSGPGPNFRGKGRIHLGGG